MRVRARDPAADQWCGPLLERNVKLTIQYDGTDFFGWQRQPDARTVQGVIEGALAELFHQHVELQGASRTDRGVHAEGQVASAACPASIPTIRLCRAINGCLPSDVRVRDVKDVAPEFHARFAALGKHYRYTIDRREVASPFRSRYALHYPYRLDVVTMREAARRFAGEHDFVSFQCTSDQAPASTVRLVHAVHVNESGRELSIDVWGRSFLYKMVRTMVGTLIEVGRARHRPEWVTEILASRDRCRAGPTVAPHGLSLVRVYYDGENIDDLAHG